MQLQQDLKEKLLNNKISELEFLGELTRLDQSTDLHEECLNNITILEEEVIKKSLTADPKLSYAYYQDLRNFYFHAFQLQISNNEIEAMENLEKADATSRILKDIDPNDYDLFTPYISATLCYMKNDLEGLKTLLKTLKDADKDDVLYSNVNVVQHLYDGLEKYKNTNYMRDY